MNPLFAAQGTSIFEIMSGLARAHDAVNLGQGFPDFGWPDDVVAKAAEGLTGQASQYPPMRGLPELRAAVADHYRRHQGLDLDAEQVIVTSGATEAIAASLIALIAPGDEVVLFQPLYDAYLPLVLRAGGVPRLVRLAPPGWRITEEALAEAFTPEDPPRRLQQSAQPDRPHVRRRGARAARRGLRPLRRRRRSPTRSGSMSSSTAAPISRSPRCPAWPSGRSRSARPARSSR